VAKTVFDVLNMKLADLKRSQEDFITSGAAKEFAAYKEVCGVIRGLALAQQEVQDLAKNYMEIEDD
jgi:ribosomal protein L17